jgi:predicted metal-binding protein
MRSSNASKAATNSCIANNRTCNGICTGYGTRAVCPPLIVLAVLSSSIAVGRPRD